MWIQGCSTCAAALARQQQHLLKMFFISTFLYVRHCRDLNEMLLFALQEPSLYTGSSVMDRHPDQQQCCMAVAFKGAAWTDPDSVPLMVMQTMLGGWDRNNTSGKHAGETATHLLPVHELWGYCLSDRRQVGALAMRSEAASASRVLRTMLGGWDRK
jgi:hypothetical protein